MRWPAGRESSQSSVLRTRSAAAAGSPATAAKFGARGRPLSRTWGSLEAEVSTLMLVFSCASTTHQVDVYSQMIGVCFGATFSEEFHQTPRLWQIIAFIWSKQNVGIEDYSLLIHPGFSFHEPHSTKLNPHSDTATLLRRQSRPSQSIGGMHHPCEDPLFLFSVP